jgi:hypothetical protein
MQPGADLLLSGGGHFCANVTANRGEIHDLAV